MALLSSGNVAFYHPLDSVTDWNGSDWSTDPPGTSSLFSVSGKLGTCITRPAGPTAQIVNTAYPGSGSVTRYTFVAWATIDEADADFFVGAVSSDSSVLQIAQLFKNGTLKIYYGDGASNFDFTANIPVIGSGSFDFYVIDLEISGTTWILRHSINGVPFTVESSETHPAFTGAPEYGTIGSRTKLDEVVLWRNLADPFTSDEINDLYNLANAGKGMDEFGDFTPHASSGDLFISGPELVSASSNLVIFGPIATSGRWIDELAVWGGNFEEFTNNELARLHTLGRTLDLPLNKYTEIINISGDLFIYATGDASGSTPLLIFAPPPDIFNTKSLYINGRDDVVVSGDLYINGHIDSVSSGDLFIVGPQLVSGETSLFIKVFDDVEILAKPFDWLLRSSDHHPQIIGILESATSVNIQLWEITDGQNSLVSVVSSGCYQIGDTGRWAWSTVNLPTYITNQRQYFYVMTANNDETFTGQFFLELPEDAKWIYPENQNDYILQI